MSLSTLLNDIFTLFIFLAFLYLMTYAVEFHGPRDKILCDYNANIPFSFVYFCMHDETPYFSNIPFLFPKV